MVDMILKRVVGGVHGWSFSQFHGAAFAVASYTEVSAQALQCWLSFVQVI